MGTTALQFVQKVATEMSNKSGDAGLVGRSILLLIKNENLLEKEKNIIIDAYNEGFNDDTTDGAETYYKDNFTNP